MNISDDTIGTYAARDSEQKALRPLSAHSTEDAIIVETNLTADEKAIIRKGREEYQQGGFVPLDLN